MDYGPAPPPSEHAHHVRVGPVYPGDHRIFLQTRHGLLLLCDSRDLQITPYLMAHREWEPVVLNRLLKPGQHVLDIGAHIGYFTTLACALVGYGGTVEAFEPHPRSYDLPPRQSAMFVFTANTASSTLSSLPERLLEEVGEQPVVTTAPAVSLDEQYQGVHAHAGGA